MDCEDRSRLLELCASTMHTYSQASIKWQDLTGRANTPEYRTAQDTRQQARAQLDLAHYQLERHESLHQCHPTVPI